MGTSGDFEALPIRLYNDGTSFAPTGSRFAAARTYAALEGGAGYWALGRTPARLFYDLAVGRDDTPDPNFTQERRDSLIAAIPEVEKQRWGKEFLEDLRTTSVSEANFMYRYMYKKDVDTALDTIEYHDGQASKFGIAFDYTSSAVLNYMAVDPITTVTTAASLGLVGIAGAGANAVRTGIASTSKAARLSSWVHNFNTTYGTAIRWGSPAVYGIDGAASGYGFWSGYNKDQELIYGNLAQLDDSPLGEMTAGFILGAAGGGIGSLMHARQFKRGAANPFTPDPVAEAAAASGVDIPSSVTMLDRGRAALKLDAFIDRVRSLNLDDETQRIVGSSRALDELGWRSADDFDELSEFAARRPTQDEFRQKLLERVEIQARNAETQSKFEADMAKWRLENPGVSDDEQYGSMIMRIVETRLGNKKDVNARDVAKSLIAWVDNRKWLAHMNGRRDVAEWLITVADDEDILRMLQLRNYEARVATEEATAISNASSRYAEVAAENDARRTQFNQAWDRAKEKATAERAFQEAEQKVREGRWEAAVNALTDAQDEVTRGIDETLGQLRRVVDDLNQTERMVADRLSKKTAGGVGERVEALRARLSRLNDIVAQHKAHVDRIKTRIASSTDGDEVRAEMKAMSAAESWKRSTVQPELNAIRAELKKFDKIDEDLRGLYFDVGPEELAKLNALGREAVDRILKFVDGIPYNEYEVLDDAIIRLWRRHAQVALTGESTAVMEGRLFLGRRSFDRHLKDGTMPLRPAMPAPKKATRPENLPEGRIMTGSDLIDEQDRILADEIAQAQVRIGTGPDGSTFNQALDAVAQRIDDLTARLNGLRRLDLKGESSRLAMLAREKDIVKQLNAAVKLRNTLNKRMNRVLEATTIPVRPVMEPVTLRGLKAQRRAKIRERINSLQIKLKELVDKSASIDEIQKIHRQIRKLQAEWLGDTKYRQNAIQLRMVRSNLEKARRRHGYMIGVNANPRIIKNLADEIDALAKEEAALVKAMSSAEKASTSVRFGTVDVRKSPLASGNLALYQARRQAALARGDADLADQWSRKIFDIFGDERDLPHFPTLIREFVDDSGRVVVTEENLNRLIRGARMNADGSITTADGIIHKPVQGRPKSAEAVPAKKAEAARDKPTPESDEATTEKIDAFLDNLVDDGSWRVANGNSILQRMRENPLLRAITEGYRRLLTAGTGQSRTIFSAVGRMRNDYEIILALANLIDSPLLLVRDFGNKSGVHMRTMHAIRTDIRGRVSRLLHNTHAITRNLGGDWNQRVRAALIRNSMDGLSPQEVQVFRLHREFYDMFSARMRSMGVNVPEGYVPSMHNVGWIMRNREDATRRLQSAYVRNYMRDTEVIDDELLAAAGIDRARYPASGTIASMTDTDRALYRAAAERTSLEEAQRSISRMTGGIEERPVDGYLRRIRFHDMHADSGLHRRFSNEILTDPDLAPMWNHDVFQMAMNYADGSGMRVMINAQLSDAIGHRVTMSELLHHVGSRLRTHMREVGDEALEQQLKETLLTLEEKIMWAYNMSGVLRARNTSRGDVATRAITATVRAPLGSFWGLQTSFVEIPKALWFNAGRHGVITAISDLVSSVAGNRHLINDLGCALDGLTVNHQASVAGMDSAVGAVNLGLAARFRAPWSRFWGIASGTVSDPIGMGNRFVDSGVAFMEAIAETNVRIGGMHYASHIAKEMAVRNANRQIYNLARRIPEIAREINALPAAVRQGPEGMRQLGEIARRYGIDRFDLARMHQQGMFRQNVADEIASVIGVLNDPDELFDVYRIRGAVSDQTMGAILDYMDEATHLAVPTNRVSTAMTTRNSNFATNIMFMLTSYTRAFGTQNMIRMGAQTGSVAALGAFGVIYAGEVMYNHLRDVINGRTTPEEIAKEWSDNPEKQLYKTASRIPFAGMYTSLGMWGLDMDPKNRESKQFGGIRPALDFVNKVKMATIDAVQGKFDNDALKLTDYAPFVGTWQFKASARAAGAIFD